MGHITGLVAKRDAYRILVGKPERKRSLGIPRLRSESSIEVDLQEVGGGTWTGLIWLRIRTDFGLL
jgi:hypothetical protein